MKYAELAEEDMQLNARYVSSHLFEITWKL